MPQLLFPAIKRLLFCCREVNLPEVDVRKNTPNGMMRFLFCGAP